MRADWYAWKANSTKVAYQCWHRVIKMILNSASNLLCMLFAPFGVSVLELLPMFPPVTAQKLYRHNNIGHAVSKSH